MKIVGITLGILILIGCATGLIFTFRALGETQDRLAETQTILSEVQEEQQETAITLEETRNELTETADSLDETRQALEEQKSQTEKYSQLYETSAAELKNTQNRLKLMEGKLALYEDTLGTQVFSNVLPPYNSGYLADLTLSNNSTAKDPTWKELLDFLYEDMTDKKLYVVDDYMCGSFAEEVHNNAEAKGIRAAFVAIHFYNEEPHAINAFKTTDRGLVYIDDTGDSTPSPISRLDTQVEVAKDKIYQGEFLFPEGWAMREGDKIVKSIEIYW